MPHHRRSPLRRALLPAALLALAAAPAAADRLPPALSTPVPAALLASPIGVEMLADGEAAGEGETLLLAVHINGGEAGQHFVERGGDGRLWVDAGFLDAIRLRPEFRPAGDGPYELAPLLEAGTWTFDPAAAVLGIRLPPAQLLAQQASLSPRSADATPTVGAAANTGWLNYGLLVTDDGLGLGNDDSTRTQLPWDLGLRHRRWLLVSGFNEILDPQPGEQAHQRLRTTLSRDLPAQRLRFSAGDLSPHGTGFGGPGLLGGLALEKAYELAPEDRRYGGLSATLLLDTPATVEILRNNQLLRRIDAEAGPLELDGLVDSYGSSGVLQLQITDLQGNRRLVELPYFISARLLKPGYADYGYYLGVPRLDYYRDDYDSERPTLVASHRLGLTPQLTLGYHAQADRDRWNLGPTFDFTALGLFEGTAVLAASDDQGIDGYGGRLDTRWRSRGSSASLQLGGEAYSREFSTLSLAASDTNKLRQGLRAGLDWSFRGDRFGIGTSLRERWQGSDQERRHDASWTHRFGGSLSLTLSAALPEGGNDDRVDLYLLYTPRQRPLGLQTITASHARPLDSDGAAASTTLDARSAFPSGAGHWYGLRVDAREAATGSDANTQAGIDLGSNLRYASAAINATNDADSGITRTRASIAGGIAYIDGGLHFGRTVRDSFALVRTGQPDIPVYAGNSLQGTTGRRGTLLVADTIGSYQVNNIRLRPEQLPMDYAVRNGIASQAIRGEGRRWGAVVEFPVERVNAVEGYLQLAGDGRPLAMAQLAIADAGTTRRTVTGEEGYFYVENLSAGSHHAIVRLDGLSCEATITVGPPGDSPINDLGDVKCVPTTPSAR